MSQGELDKGVMNTPICVGNVKPRYCQRTFLLPSCLDDCCQLSLMLCDSRDGGKECLLQVRVGVIVCTHVPQPSLLQDAREQLAEGNRAEVSGDDGSSLAELFGISLAAATFQADWTAPSMMTLLKRSRRAG